MRNKFWKISMLALVSMGQVTSQTNFWQQMSAPYNGDVRALTFTNSGVTIAGTYGGGVWRSTNDGQFWSMSNTGIGNYYVHALATGPNGNVFAAVGSVLYRSANEGVSWEQATVTSSEFRCLAITRSGQSSGTIFAGSTSGVTRSTDNGGTWSPLQMFNVAPLPAIAVSPSGIVYAASTSNGIFRSTDNGATWVQTGLTLGTFGSLTTNSASHVFAATYANVYRTLDSGITWQQVVIAASDVKSVTVAPNGHIFAALNTEGIYRSTNNGTVWDSINTGLTNRNGTLLGVSPSGYVFAVAGARFFRSTGPVTTVGLVSSTPGSFRLEQNYPNPFNPTTTITFSVVGTYNYTSLRVFDLLGREVATVVDEVKEAGVYNYQFSVHNSQFASGVYFYRLDVKPSNGKSGFMSVKKMVLIR